MAGRVERDPPQERKERRLEREVALAYVQSGREYQHAPLAGAK